MYPTIATAARMTLSRAHTSAKSADLANITTIEQAPDNTNPVLRVWLGVVYNYTVTLTITLK